VPGDTLCLAINQPACIAIWHATQMACCCSRQWAVELDCMPLCTHTSVQVTCCFTMTKTKPACPDGDPLVDPQSKALSHNAAAPQSVLNAFDNNTKHIYSDIQFNIPQNAV
jgi:hypothetical protein